MNNKIISGIQMLIDQSADEPDNPMHVQDISLSSQSTNSDVPLRSLRAPIHDGNTSQAAPTAQMVILRLHSFLVLLN